MCLCTRVKKGNEGRAAERLSAKQLQMSGEVLRVSTPTEELELPLCLTQVICIAPTFAHTHTHTRLSSVSHSHIHISNSTRIA